MVMRNLLRLLIGATGLWAGIASADPFTGTCECSKSDPQHLLPAGDRPEHSFGVQASKCSWSKPLQIGGDTSKDGVATEMIEISGNSIRVRGLHEITMQSGDKLAAPYQGSGVSADKGDTPVKGTFTFGVGTGKLKGIKGKGTFDCKPDGEGVKCEVQGEYNLGK